MLKKPYLVWKALPPRTLVSILSYRIHSSFCFPLPLAFDFEKTVPDLYTVAKVPIRSAQQEGTELSFERA